MYILVDFLIYILCNFVHNSFPIIKCELPESRDQIYSIYELQSLADILGTNKYVLKVWTDG